MLPKMRVVLELGTLYLVEGFGTNCKNVNMNASFLHALCLGSGS